MLQSTNVQSMKNVKQKECKHFHTDLIGKFSFLQAYFLSHPHGLGGGRPTMWSNHYRQLRGHLLIHLI